MNLDYIEYALTNRDKLSDVEKLYIDTFSKKALEIFEGSTKPKAICTCLKNYGKACKGGC